MRLLACISVTAILLPTLVMLGAWMKQCHPEEQSDRRISQAHASQVRAVDALVTCPVEKILFLSCIIINTFRPLFHRTAIPLARSWSKREPRVTH